MRIAYLDCFSGISGDMLLGAFVDAGVPLDKLAATAEALNVGARLDARKVMRGGLTGTKVDVLVPDSVPDTAATHVGAHTHSHSHAHTHTHGGVTHTHEHTHAHSHTHAEAHDHASAHKHQHERGHAHQPSEEPVPPGHTIEHDHRSLATILGIIAAAPLSGSVKRSASRAFQLLGEAEAAIHSIPIERVHFHEVGAVDTIVDIVCAAAGAEHLAIDRWFASPLNVGSGTVEAAHGTLPVPAPATLALLPGAPMYAAGPPMERVTPTGAAILRMLDVTYGPLPAMRTTSTGYGAGGRDTPGEPNLLRILVGEGGVGEGAARETAATPDTTPNTIRGTTPGTEPIAILETVVDDSTPQLISYVSEQLLNAGAWDVYRIPVQMKKGRSGVQITVLCHPDRLAALRDLLFRETTTIGAHWRIEHKLALAREFAEVATPWGPVRIKIARNATGAVSNAAPEYEDCRRIAEQHGVPLKQVMFEAARLYAAGGSNQDNQ